MADSSTNITSKEPTSAPASQLPTASSSTTDNSAISTSQGGNTAAITELQSNVAGNANSKQAQKVQQSSASSPSTASGPKKDGKPDAKALKEAKKLAKIGENLRTHCS